MKMKRRYKKFLKLLIYNLLITRNKGCIFFTDIFLTLGSRLILVAQQGNGSRNYYYFTLKSCFPDADNRFNKWVSILLELGLKDRIENEN
jgi:hypothetical protein